MVIDIGMSASFESAQERRENEAQAMREWWKKRVLSLEEIRKLLRPTLSNTRDGYAERCC